MLGFREKAEFGPFFAVLLKGDTETRLRGGAGGIRTFGITRKGLRADFTEVAWNQQRWLENRATHLSAQTGPLPSPIESRTARHSVTERGYIEVLLRRQSV